MPVMRVPSTAGIHRILSIFQRGSSNSTRAKIRVSTSVRSHTMARINNREARTTAPKFRQTYPQILPLRGRKLNSGPASMMKEGGVLGRMPHTTSSTSNKLQGPHGSRRARLGKRIIKM